MPGFPVPSGMVSLVLSSNSMLFQSLGPQHPRRPPCGLLDPITPLRSPLPRWHLVVSLLMSPSVRPPQFSACQALGWPTGSGLCGCCPVDRPWHQLFPVQEVLEQACLPGSVQSIVFLLHDAPAKGGNEPGRGHRIARLSHSPDLNSSFIRYLQGPSSLVPRASRFRGSPALPSSAGAGGESRLAVHEPLVSWASPLDIAASLSYRSPCAAPHGWTASVSAR